MTRAIVRIPASLRRFTHGSVEVLAEGDTVAECLADLREHRPGIGPRILDEANDLRRSVSLFLGAVDVRSLYGLRTLVHDGDVLSILEQVPSGKDVQGSGRPE